MAWQMSGLALSASMGVRCRVLVVLDVGIPLSSTSAGLPKVLPHKTNTARGMDEPAFWRTLLRCSRHSA